MSSVLASNWDKYKGTAGKMAIAAAVGVGSVVAAPVVLAAAGFTSAGVLAGSIAAGVQVIEFTARRAFKSQI